MPTLSSYKKEFNDYLDQIVEVQEPVNLYEPFAYIMNLGGKRLRPVLAMLATDLLGGDSKNALPAALAIEVFHNFSLVHDDIMDDAPLRRGKQTVHEKWDVNTGILSGDVMLIKSYDLLGSYNGDQFKDLVSIFNETAIKVCEGQQYDMDFESREDVEVEEYLTMIGYKTAVLIAAALKMGAIIAGAPENQQEAIYNYGLNLGTAFQLQDDFLDAFGDSSQFGKQVGGDIIENKKTYLYLKARELATTKDKKELMDLYTLNPKDPSTKIKVVKNIFERSGAVEETKAAISHYTNKAFQELNALKSHDKAVEVLTEFGEKLMLRKV